MFAIAYRMLGSVGEAEDVVQEAFLRLHRAGTQERVHAPKAFLTTVATRLCIDRLRSAQARREQYVGTWLPEPLVVDEALEAVAEDDLAESLSLAFMVLLESLTPLERAVFLLRDVFDHSYEEIARTVGRREDAVRQIAARARRHVHERRPRFSPDPQERDALAERFFRAARSGDRETLAALLAPDATFYGDGGGKVRGAIRRPISGRDRVTRLLLGFGRSAQELGLRLRPARVNRQPGALVLAPDGAIFSVLALDVATGEITAIRSIVNPEKLRHLRAPDARERGAS